MRACSIHTVACSGTVTLPPDTSRSGFRVDMPSGGHVTLGGGLGQVAIGAGGFWEPRVVPIGEIKMVSAGAYVVSVKSPTVLSMTDPGAPIEKSLSTGEWTEPDVEPETGSNLTEGTSDGE